MKKVITFGTFDLLHIGHIKILQRAKSFGDYLIVGVSSDQLNISKKNKEPIYSIHDRLEIIRNIKCVDEVFIEESLEYKEKYIKYYNADILIMGDDWAGKFDNLSHICNINYLPRTPEISTTEIREKIVSRFCS